jgi:sulfur-oxidizing protein SoxB
MAKLIEDQRAPYAGKLSEELARTEALLYRRGNFNGSFDQLILDALMEAKGAEIAFSPGFRWGTSLLPGEAITLEQVMNLTAITYPDTSLSELTGTAVKALMEDVCDNLFHPDPYYQQGGDMVRVGGMSYSCTPGNKIGARIGDMRLRGRPIEADKVYKLASWAPVAEGPGGEPVWEILSRYLRDKKVVGPRRLELPRLIGTAGNLGVA